MNRRVENNQPPRSPGPWVTFTQETLQMGPVTTAVLDDTCGNLIQIASHA